ncbi:hypothetical protein AB0E69_27775 [Kribbella sp. NPDC026611]|uniref:type II toxin-antitoxin system HicB family antitoxin n=1 Tax=Kribbella sp. NPDC026611 TaxID=3154911 RepID=UPI0033FF3768
MKTYEVTVSRDGRWWMVSIPELDGLTQARRLDEVEQMAREYIALATDVPLSRVAVEVAGIEADGRDLLEARTLVDGLRRRAMDLEALVAVLARDIAAELTTANVPVRDVSTVLGVSHQRVSQLVQAAGADEETSGEVRRRSKQEFAHDLVVQLDDGRSLQVVEVISKGKARVEQAAAPEELARPARKGARARPKATQAAGHSTPRKQRV